MDPACQAPGLSGQRHVVRYPTPESPSTLRLIRLALKKSNKILTIVVVIGFLWRKDASIDDLVPYPNILSLVSSYGDDGDNDDNAVPVLANDFFVDTLAIYFYFVQNALIWMTHGEGMGFHVSNSCYSKEAAKTFHDGDFCFPPILKAEMMELVCDWN